MVHFIYVQIETLFAEPDKKLPTVQESLSVPDILKGSKIMPIKRFSLWAHFPQLWETVHQGAQPLLISFIDEKIQQFPIPFQKLFRFPFQLA